MDNDMTGCISCPKALGRYLKYLHYTIEPRQEYFTDKYIIIPDQSRNRTYIHRVFATFTDFATIDDTFTDFATIDDPLNYPLWILEPSTDKEINQTLEMCLTFS
jgi:hypothetical protein